MTTIRVLDTETTGLPPDAAIVEFGFSDIIITDGRWGPVSWPIAGLVNPGRPIPPEVSAIHHIIDADVAGALPPDDAFRRLMDGADIFAAHNAEFDRQFFGGGDKPWICTLKVARRVWPDAPSHGNQVLRYWLGVDLDRDVAAIAHRAGPDAYVTAHILSALLSEGVTLDEMIQWTAEPSLLPRINFGKHKGAKWPDVPGDYLHWLSRQADLDRDVKYTLRHEMERRQTAYSPSTYAGR